MRQISLGADRANGQPDAWMHGAFSCDKAQERIFGISLWDSTLIQRLAQFPRFCVTMGKLVCVLLVVASCDHFHTERNSSWECT